MAAELGTMRVTEQIDALHAMATEPVHYLIVPRVNASILMLPLLTLLGDAIGILGGWLVSVGLFGANSYIYLERTFQFLEVNDVTSGLIKAAFFGLFMLVALVVLGVFILEIEDIPIGERGERLQVTARFPSVAGIDRKAAMN